ncbi:SMC-Scp complex subunit ScpB [Sulfuriroseicoccus oceanibius]|uniref:SMC-Scp complex subunit ScpB n=1 Tax=Sulfuriroseicoccus oceanibius TaxID=2707525 RepID=A0A6B3L4Z0_9BACT|nr:SMC-Scp complex subunit ScpB [Sulfuriroseicoccus oceanibius]QQL43926.1 SMC-Scp complex subunit ScpB [Sulfuriroseicoccus oceanibius]
MTEPSLHHVIEALILASESPLSSEALIDAAQHAVALKQSHLEALADQSGDDNAEPAALPELFQQLQKLTIVQVIDAVDTLNKEYQEAGRSMVIRERPRGWQVMTRPEFAEFVHGLFPEHKPSRLSGPALETMAIIAYRQPVTKAEIEAVRGVSVDGMVQKLLDLELIKIGGRAELPGRPLLYISTEKFLEHFNVKSVDELPNAAELRRAPFPSAEEVHAPKQDPAGGSASDTPADASQGSKP